MAGEWGGLEKNFVENLRFLLVEFVRPYGRKLKEEDAGEGGR